ncbi:MAG: PD-(D/E)XK nuclease family protein [Opitutales bacterium]|nr:PD-(D/E)XK nuclease family protein [Opitutales bacterium]
MNETIQEKARRGKQFEVELKSEWEKKQPGLVETQKSTQWNGKNGRIDIFVDDGDLMLVVEAKSTNWEKVRRKRIKEYARRHLRQLFRYADGVMHESRKKGDCLDVCVGISYPLEPSDPFIREELRRVFDEFGASLSFEKENG